MNERSIFLEALDKEDPTQRSAFLDTACAGDDALRQRVEALLQSHAGAGSFLDKLAPERVAEELAIQHPDDETQGDSPDKDEGGADLGFLTPVDKPDVLGRLGHYDILEVIGRGGMGIVLRAFDEKLHRIVAIKVMAAQLATNATARQRFSREAQAAAAVSHDHIVTIHAVEEANGLPYLVMQYVAGMSLQERLDKWGALQLHEILRIGLQSASGLAAAHAQGLIHRDIKPANILLENGVERVKVTDFGLARAATEASLTQSGVVAGTPQYMSPEQAEGKAIDQRTDLFSLGSVLYAMCTGRAPFRAYGSMAVLKRVCEESPTPIRETNPEMPDWMVAIIDKLHAKEPAERFQSAAEVAELLGRHLAQVQHPSVVGHVSNALVGPKGGWQPAPRRRRWAVAAAVLVLLLGGLSLTEATGVTQIRATVIRIFTPDGTLVVEVDDPAVKVTIEGDGGVVITGAGPQEVRLKPGSYRLLATKNGNSIKNDVVTVRRGDKQVVKVSLESTKGSGSKVSFSPPPPGPLDALDPAKISAQKRFTWQPKELVAVLGEHSGRQWSSLATVAFSRNGELAASAGIDGFVYIWDAKTLRLLKMLEGHSGYVSRVVFSRDGQRLLSAGADRTLRLWNVAKGQELKRFAGHTGCVWAVAFSPDERQILSGADDKTVRLWNVATGNEQLPTFQGHSGAVWSVDFSADGTRILSGATDATVRLWEAATRKELKRISEGLNKVQYVAFLPDGHSALVRDVRHDNFGTLRLWDLQTGQVQHRYAAGNDSIYTASISADGRQVLTGGQDHMLRLWDLESGRERSVSEPFAAHANVALSTDAKRALTANWSGSVGLWDLESRKDLNPQTEVGPLCYYPDGLVWRASRVAFSPDGRSVLACMARSIARQWDVETGGKLPNFEMNGLLWGIAYCPDGRVICAGHDGMIAFDGKTREKLYRFVAAADIGVVALTRDGARLASGDAKGRVQVWDAKTGRELFRFDGPAEPVPCLAISPDGGCILAGFGNDVRLIDLNNGRERLLRGAKAKVYSVAISPDNMTAAVGDNNGSVSIWNLGDQIPTPSPLPKWHQGNVHSFSFSPDGKILASSGHLGEVVLWDVATHEKLRSWKFPRSVHCVAFAPDGRHVATANVNGTVYILRLAKP